MTSTSILPYVTVILAISGIVSPILFGFCIWKLSQWFVSKESFSSYVLHAVEDRKDMKDSISELKDRLTHIERLLQESHRRGGIR